MPILGGDGCEWRGLTRRMRPPLRRRRPTAAAHPPRDSPRPGGGSPSSGYTGHWSITPARWRAARRRRTRGPRRPRNYGCPGRYSKKNTATRNVPSLPRRPTAAPGAARAAGRSTPPATPRSTSATRGSARSARTSSSRPSSASRPKTRPRTLAGFDFRIKGVDRLKEKVVGLAWNVHKGLTAGRGAFRDRLTRCASPSRTRKVAMPTDVWKDVERLKPRGSSARTAQKHVGIRAVQGDQHAMVGTALWGTLRGAVSHAGQPRGQGTNARGVRAHPEHNRTDSGDRTGSRGTEMFQNKANAQVPIPPRRKRRRGLPTGETRWLKRLATTRSSTTSAAGRSPVGVLRRIKHDGGERDETFGSDFRWGRHRRCCTRPSAVTSPMT